MKNATPLNEVFECCSSICLLPVHNKVIFDLFRFEQILITTEYLMWFGFVTSDIKNPLFFSERMFKKHPFDLRFSTILMFTVWLTQCFVRNGTRVLLLIIKYSLVRSSLPKTLEYWKSTLLLSPAYDSVYILGERCAALMRALSQYVHTFRAFNHQLRWKAFNTGSVQTPLFLVYYLHSPIHAYLLPFSLFP